MTKYIKIPKNNPHLDTFKDDYVSTVGEKIQDNPLENEQGTHYLVGSSRLTQEQADGLVSRNPSVTIGAMPAGWKTKQSLTE